MNLDLTDAQADLDATLVDILQRESSDEARLASLESGGFLDVVREAGPIEGALVVERAAEALMASLAGRVLVGPLAGVTDLPTMVGLTDAKRGRVVRHATRCESFFVVDGPDVLLATRDDVEVEPVASFFGSDFGRVTVRRGTTLDAAAAARVRQGWEAALAIEAGALMVAAIEMTAEYVTRRVQFGKPIGSIPTVQHQLARAYAMAVATRWLGRRGVWFVDDSFLTASAATYACHAAWVTYTNTHQVTGAIGITSEYGLVDRTNRILAIRQEFGGQRAHARRAARARRDVPKHGRRRSPRPASPEIGADTPVGGLIAERGHHILSSAQGCDQGVLGGALVNARSTTHDYATGGASSVARRLYGRAGVTASDIDVAQLYDNFTGQVLLGLEDFDFCDRGASGEFVASGGLSPAGPLPTNTSGGNLSEAYMQGLNQVVEAVRQIRGQSTNQVAGCELCLVTSSPGMPTSAIIVSSL